MLTFAESVLYLIMEWTDYRKVICEMIVDITSYATVGGGNVLRSFFKQEGFVLTTDTPQKIIGSGGISNFIECDCHEQGVGIYVWKLNESLFESLWLQSILEAIQEGAEYEIENLKAQLGEQINRVRIAKRGIAEIKAAKEIA